MTAPITQKEIYDLVDVEAQMATVDRALEVAITSTEALLQFMGRYTSYNAWFGSNVAALAGHVGRSRGVFMDPEEDIYDLADRSILVASYFFDAARDEFDDSDTPIRDTHRCLAQACIKGMVSHFDLGVPQINKLLEHPVWLSSLGNSVERGYAARGTDRSSALFRSMGYHIGSEVLADQEFTHIDRAFHSEFLGLVSYLKGNDFPLSGQNRNGYAWISLHSSYGKESAAKELDHFDWALQGVRVALSYVPHGVRADYRHQVDLGVLDFVRDHQEFFGNVSA